MARATTGIAYLALGLTLLSGLVFTVFVTVPAWSRWRETRDRLAERERARDERQTFLTNIEARAAELKAHGLDAQALGVTFPETKAPADLTAILGALAAKNGVILSQITELKERRRESKPTPAPTPTPAAASGSRGGALEAGEGEERPRSAGPTPTTPHSSSAPAVEFSLSVRGSYAQVRSFIGDLERSLRLFDLPTVDLSASAPDAGGVLEARLTVVSYLAKP